MFTEYIVKYSDSLFSAMINEFTYNDKLAISVRYN